MGKKDKKKGKGAEKTAAKTEKKAMQKAKKELAEKGEDDIEKLIAEFQAKDKEQGYVGEEVCSPPSPRSAFSLCAHAEKDELILFGGEYFNGSKTEMYSDLFFYNIKQDQWSILQCSHKPPPRCSHQSVILSQRGAEMWVFGGEFASPSRSNFYHYKDLWVYHFSERRWEQIKETGGPASRSGHRMVASRKRLIVFGGFQETVRDYKYFNDVHMFDLETYKWTKIEPVGNAPCPRSGCQMAALADGQVLLYGGYSRMKVKKDVDKGVYHSDMYYLQLDDKSSVPKWKWVSVKQSGIQPVPRSGFSIAAASNNRAYLFGGVHDEEDSEEVLTGNFHNDLYCLEMDRGRWLSVTLHGKTDPKRKRQKTKNPVNEENMQQLETADLADECSVEELDIMDDNDDEAKQTEVKTYEDDVFTVKIAASNSALPADSSCSTDITSNLAVKLFCPCPRMSAAVAIKHGILYLYGGLYEDGDKQLTLSDFYSLDLHKLDEWKILIAHTTKSLEWCESEDSSSEDSGDEETGDEEGDEDKETGEIGSEANNTGETEMDTS